MERFGPPSKGWTRKGVNIRTGLGTDSGRKKFIRGIIAAPWKTVVPTSRTESWELSQKRRSYLLSRLRLSGFMGSGLTPCSSGVSRHLLWGFSAARNPNPKRPKHGTSKPSKGQSPKPENSKLRRRFSWLWP